MTKPSPFSKILALYQMVHFGGQFFLEEGFHLARNGGDFCDVDAGLDAHFVQHVDGIFGGDVAFGALNEGAAAQATKSGIEAGDACSQGGEHVCQSLARAYRAGAR